MGNIRATCYTCGDIEIQSADMIVRVCRDNNIGTFQFDCPKCQDFVKKFAEPRIITLLVTSGVNLVTWSLPEELHEQHEGDPISHDDILDAHLIMADEAQWEAARIGLGISRPELPQRIKDGLAELVLNGSYEEIARQVDSELEGD